MNKSRILRPLLAASMAVSLGACSHSASHESASNQSTTTTTQVAEISPSVEQRPVPYVAGQCAKFALELTIDEGSRITDPNNELSFFVTNLGSVAANPNQPDVLTENTIDIRHLNNGKSETHVYIHDYSTQDFVFPDGSSTHVEVKHMPSWELVSGWVCDKSA